MGFRLKFVVQTVWIAAIADPPPTAQELRGQPCQCHIQGDKRILDGGPDTRVHTPAMGNLNRSKRSALI